MANSSGHERIWSLHGAMIAAASAWADEIMMPDQWSSNFCLCAERSTSPESRTAVFFLCVLAAFPPERVASRHFSCACHRFFSFRTSRMQSCRNLRFALSCAAVLYVRKVCSKSSKGVATLWPPQCFVALTLPALAISLVRSVIERHASGRDNAPNWPSVASLHLGHLLTKRRLGRSFPFWCFSRPSVRKHSSRAIWEVRQMASGRTQHWTSEL